MRIVIGCDHAGFEIKQLLKEAMHKTLLKRNPETTFQDIGCHSTDSVHYPEIAKTVASGVVKKDADYGLLICGTGIGMCMVANKVNGIRAALCHDLYTSVMARQHNDANILCIGARVLTPSQAINIAQTFFETDFLGGRHEVRVKMID